MSLRSLQKGALSASRPALTKKAAKVTAQYWRDYDRYNLDHGNHPLIVRGRQRLEAIPGAYSLLRQMLDFDPARRITMSAALESPVFEGLAEGDGIQEEGVSFMTYWRGGNDTRPLAVV